MGINLWWINLLIHQITLKITYPTKSSMIYIILLYTNIYEICWLLNFIDNLPSSVVVQYFFFKDNNMVVSHKQIQSSLITRKLFWMITFLNVTHTILYMKIKKNTHPKPFLIQNNDTFICSQTNQLTSNTDKASSAN